MERLKWIVGGYRFLWAVIGILGMTHHANCQIAMSSDLNCKFASPCRWQNSTTTMGRWFLADYLDIDNYYTIKPMSEKKEDFFVYASTHNGLPPAELVSDLVNCQLGGGRIKYWYYLTGKTSSLQICLRTPTSAGAPAAEPQCYNGLSSTRAHQWAFNTVELPPFSKPMEIVFRAFYGAPDDSIALDDIQYDAILCEIHNEGTSQGAGGNFRNEPTLLNSQDSGFEQFRQHASIYDSIPSTFNSFKETSYRKAPTSLNGNVAGGQCPAIDCSFDDESICQYMTFTEFDDFDLIMGDASMKKLRHWDLSNRQISNSLTGIPKDVTGQGFFAFAGNSEDPEETFVLVTKQKVHVRNAAKLNFSVYMAGRKGRLRVCIENLQKCSFLKLGSEITVDARQWFKHYIQVPSGSYNIIFVADRLEKNYVIGLDQIFLQHEGGGSDLCA